MVSKFKILGIFFIGLIVLLPGLAYGQGLGSTNSLFTSGNKKKVTSKTKTRTARKVKKTVKKKVKPKRKSTASRVKKKKPTRTTKRRTTARKENEQIPKPFTLRRVEGPIDTTTVILYGGPPKPDSNSLENLILAGNEARNERNYPKAEKEYRAAEKVDPRDSRASYGLGNIFSDQQRWEDAEKAYRKAIALEPNSANQHLAISYVLTQPVVGANLGNRYREAEIMARRAIQLDPNNAIAYDQLGVALELQGKIGIETEQAFQKAIALDPNFALAYAHLGRLHRRNGRIQNSVEAYQQSIRLVDDVPTKILVADVMQSQQRFADSEQLLRSALNEDPNNPTALFLLGRALTTRKSYKHAEAVLLKSMAVSPNSFVSYALLSSLYVRMGELDKAEATLNRATRVVSENERKHLAQEYEEAGDGFGKENRIDDAQRMYEKANQLDPQNKTVSEKLSAG